MAVLGKYVAKTFENPLVLLGTCAMQEELRGWIFCPSQAHTGAVSLLTLVITMRPGQKEQWS